MPADFVDRRLDALRREMRLRDPPVLDADGVRGTLAGRAVTVFCSNDYLGLRGHPSVKAGAIAALERYGGGAGSSRLIAGNLPIHRELEEAVAAWIGTEAALVCTSGYQANLATLVGLTQPGDAIASDALNHASLIDGCRLSAARVTPFPHGDTYAAVRALLDREGEGFIVGEGLYSMDGDRGPVAGWASAAEAAGALVIVDEAHAVGVLGPEGRGVCAEAEVSPFVRVGTFGKALGAHGAFVACDAGTRDLILNRGRGFVFTTGLSPAVAGAALAGLRIARSPEGDERRATLLARAQRLRHGLLHEGFQVHGDPGQPIVPVVVGDEATALGLSAALLDAGLFAVAIRPPTVPEGACRVRITLSADHTVEDVDALLLAMARL